MSALGTLYFLIGKMGAGKTTFSAQFSKDNDVILISEDEWLNALYPNEIHDFDDFMVRHHKLLKVLRPHVQQILKSGSSVILDFPANTKIARQWYLDITKEIGARHQGIYLEATDEQCIKQVAKRRKEQPQRAKFDTPQMFELVTQYFEVPSVDEGMCLEIIKNQ